MSLVQFEQLNISGYMFLNFSTVPSCRASNFSSLLYFFLELILEFNACIFPLGDADNEDSKVDAINTLVVNYL